MTKRAVDEVLSDPDNHYPYDRDRALEAGIPVELVDASERVVEAQEAYLREPSDENLTERNAAEQNAQDVSSRLAPERSALVQRTLQQEQADRNVKGAHVNAAGGDK